MSDAQNQMGTEEKEPKKMDKCNQQQQHSPADYPPQGYPQAPGHLLQGQPWVLGHPPQGHSQCTACTPQQYPQTSAYPSQGHPPPPWYPAQGYPITPGYPSQGHPQAQGYPPSVQVFNAPPTQQPTSVGRRQEITFLEGFCTALCICCILDIIF